MQALFGTYTKRHIIPSQALHRHIDANMAPHTMATYSQLINSYVDSQSVIPQPPLPIEPHLAMSSRAARYNHPEWVGMLQHYHRELDKLREDWALEVLGRSMFETTYYHHLQNSPNGYIWPSHMIHKPWPRRLQFWSRLQLDAIWRYWRFHVKEGLYPLKWGPLQNHYMQRRDEIERKYCSQLGLLRAAKQNKD